MKYRHLLLLLISFGGLSGFRSPLKNMLTFKTSTGHIVKVFQGQFFYDDKVILKRRYDDDILYENKANRLIEDHGVIFLFIAVDDRPNLENLNAFLITPSKATLVANAILSPIKDYDYDGYLEFGGRDLTEIYTKQDSMYYIPTSYYEIHEGKILPDNLLTRREDIKLNGVYLPPNKQLNKDGYCCKVIPHGKKHP